MDKLNLPPGNFKIDKKNGKTVILDPIRKKYLVLTPEEWVRQHFIQFLVQHHQYPTGLISLEAGLKYNGMPRRSDIVVYNQQGKPHLLVECKAPQVALQNKGPWQSALAQVAAYNELLMAPYIILTNGLRHFVMSTHGPGHLPKPLKQIPPPPRA